MSKRLWSDEEHIIALYLYRFGYEELGISYSRIAQIIGRSPDSLIMRFANYLSIESRGSGIDGGGERAKEIFLKYKDVSKEEIRKLVLNYLSNIAKQNAEMLREKDKC